MDRRQLRGDTVAHYRKYALGKRAVYFAVTVAHSKEPGGDVLRALASRRNISTRTAPTAERIAAAKRLASGETLVLCNVDILGEGYDVSAQAGQSVSHRGGRPLPADALAGAAPPTGGPGAAPQG